MDQMRKWQRLHDEIENSSEVKSHHDRAKAALALGKHADHQKHLEAYRDAVKAHPKYAEYKAIKI